MEFLTGKEFLRAMKSALSLVSIHAVDLNRMNVFPVPDGDTGFNMSKTLGAIIHLEEKEHLGEMVNDVSEAMLKASRGNSGTIMATFFLGFASNLKSKDKVDSSGLIRAFKAGKESAYTSISNPTEGTMLTLMNDISRLKPLSSLEDTLEMIESVAYVSLKNTPNLLPLLKESNVLDSGAYGFYYIVKGWNESIHGKKAEEIKELEEISSSVIEHDEDLEYRYCTEAVLRKHDEYIGDKKASSFESFLNEKGGSVVFIETPSLLKFHVHTNDFSIIKMEASKYGEVLDFKADDMQAQVRNENFAESELGFVFVVDGEGYKDIFSAFEIPESIIESFGGDVSYEEIESAVRILKAKTIVIFPNSKNAIPTATLFQKDSKKNVVVLKSYDQPSCISALGHYDPSESAESNIFQMSQALLNTRTLSLARSDKEYRSSLVSARKGDYVLIRRSEVLFASKNIEDVLNEAASLLSDFSAITVYTGKGVSEEEGEKVVNLLSEAMPEADDVMLSIGGAKRFLFQINGENY